MAVQDYSELKVYQLGFDSAMKIYQLSKEWPTHEKYSLTDQIRRSSRSVCGNIAEAWRKRRYPAHFVSKLSDSDSEAAETIVWLDFAHACEYLPDQQFQFWHGSKNWQHPLQFVAAVFYRAGVNAVRIPRLQPKNY